MRLIDAAVGAHNTGAAGGAADEGSSVPELKQLVTEATRALALLDVSRLQELALNCETLTRMPPAKTREDGEERARQARTVRGDMAVFARVLEATRANLKVMERLRELRQGKVAYTDRPERCRSWSPGGSEGADGND
jgi:hypothetical protein